MQNNNNLSADGSGLVDYLVADYDDLVRLFGQPSEGDGYKTDAQWTLQTPFGIATIYNYKDGKCYRGASGLAVEDITEWHIGGTNNDAGFFVIGFFTGWMECLEIIKK